MGGGESAECIGGEFLMADYLVTDTELTSVANAIRTKGGTSASLSFPTGFVSAIADIPSGGGGGSSTSVEVSDFVGNIYYVDAADGEVKETSNTLSASVPSGSIVVLLWDGPKPPFDGATLTNLTLVYSINNGSRATYTYTDVCQAS